MQATNTCPKCAGRKLWRIEKVTHESPRPGGGTLRVVLDRHIGDPDRRIVGTGGVPRESVGHYDVFVCARCGYAEWYARDIDEMYENAAEGVTLIED